jgi:hypothetical protein
MAHQNVTAVLRGPQASVVKYDIIAAINGAGLAKVGLSKDLAQRLTLLIVSRYNWLKNEISTGHMQLSALWSVDIRRVKRLLAELRSLGVLAVKRAGRKGHVTVYCLDLLRIAEITRPLWNALGSDIAARLDAAFPYERAAPGLSETTTTTDDGSTDTRCPKANVVMIGEVRQQRAEPIRQAIVGEFARPTYDRWIKPLILERQGTCLVCVAQSSFVASYVERQFGLKIERAVQQIYPDIAKVIFKVAPS